jgi:hypothetical protein
MNADREGLEQIRAQLEEALRNLPGTGAPAGIAEHVELALRRLNSFLEMIDGWDKGNSS